MLRIIVFLFILRFHLNAQHHFFIDFTQVSYDQVTVKAEINSQYHDSIDFHFPKTIPGTYDILNYGKYIEEFNALGKDLQNLKHKKINYNTYRIYQPQNLHLIVYKVNDTFDTLVTENNIFKPAGTNINAYRNFIINGGGFIGFFDNEENQPFTLTLTIPDSLDTFSAHPKQTLPSKKDKMFRFNYKSYHDFIDNPIMICPPDTAQFHIQNTKVTITCFHEKGIKVAHDTKLQLEKSLKAIGNFLPQLPVDQYVFLIYLKDFEPQVSILNSKGKFFKKIKVLFQLSGMSFGALEHGKSSVYYLFDDGNKSFIKELQSVAIHEFLHILTPLNLHTEHVGNFNYINPIFSKHLWLYEGSTEYHAGLVQIQNHLLSIEEYFEKYIQEKLLNAKKFPIRKMTFAQMSQNVMLPKYQKEYYQVYELGALLAMYLDIEIIHLTDGQKTLKTVILELLNKYGLNQNIPEEKLIAEFVNIVHPDLQKFFDNYILGNQYPNFEEQLKKVGIIYQRVNFPSIPVVIIDGEIVKIQDKAYKVFQIGDHVTRQMLDDACYDAEGNLLSDGIITHVEVIRNGQKQVIHFPVRTKMGEYQFVKNPNASQKEVQRRKIWIGQ